MDKIDRIIAKIWADAARRANQNDAEPDFTSADASMTPDTRPSPVNTKGQRTNKEEMLRGRAARIAKPAAKQPSSHTTRKRTNQHSTRSRWTLRTRRHESKGHQHTLKANSSTHESRESTSMKNDGTNIAQCHSEATARKGPIRALKTQSRRAVSCT